MSGTRPDPVETAKAYVEARHPEARAAFLGGSTSRGEATATSDLDIVIVTDIPRAYRESLVFDGWPVEVFVNNLDSLHDFWAKDVARRHPTLPAMCTGIVLRGGGGLADELIREAQSLLDAGPSPFTADELDRIRYMISDTLDDLRGGTTPEESLFIAALLVDEVTTLTLVSAGLWKGRGKWSIRLLRHHDPASADAVVAALRSIAATNDVHPLITWAQAALDVVGGRLWEGYRAIAPESNPEAV